MRLRKPRRRRPLNRRRPRKWRPPRRTRRLRLPMKRLRPPTTRTTPSNPEATRSSPEAGRKVSPAAGPTAGRGRIWQLAPSGQRVSRWIELHGLPDPAQEILDARVDAGLSVAGAALFSPADDADHLRRPVREGQRPAAVA